MLRGNGTNAVTVAMPGSGAFALVVADAAPLAPPPPVVGASLPPSSTPLPDPANLRASGTVTPTSSPARPVPELAAEDGCRTAAASARMHSFRNSGRFRNKILAPNATAGDSILPS